MQQKIYPGCQIFPLSFPLSFLLSFPLSFLLSCPPSFSSSLSPSLSPSLFPSFSPSFSPSLSPSLSPSFLPSSQAIIAPRVQYISQRVSHKENFLLKVQPNKKSIILVVFYDWGWTRDKLLPWFLCRTTGERGSSWALKKAALFCLVHSLRPLLNKKRFQVAEDKLDIYKIASFISQDLRWKHQALEPRIHLKAP